MSSLVPFTEMLRHAKEQNYAVPAFNVVNMESIQAITQAAETEGSPLIIQLYHADLDFAGADYMIANAAVAASHCSVPIAVSLDHGRSYEQAKRCIDAGFTGVMIDLSSEDLEENIRITSEVVCYAHARGVSVEAELGRIFDASEPIEVRNSGMTSPKVAIDFVRRTGVDALAISIGTAHGLYSSAPIINFDLLEEISSTLSCPVVVHGGSNIPDDELAMIVKKGASKINIGTDLNNAFNAGVIQALQQSGAIGFMRDILGTGRSSLFEVAREKIRLLRMYAKTYS